MANCLAYGVDYSSELELLDFIQNNTLMSHDDDEKEAVLSARMEIGLTMALAGGFLYFIGKLSGKQPVENAGLWFIGTGVAMAVDAGGNQIDENRKDK